VRLLHGDAETRSGKAILFIRLIVGCVFLSEGIQKFLFSETLGAGRFARTGIPAPEILAPFVGASEIVCGTLVLAGLHARLATIPLIVVMVVAIATTKVPICLERGFWAMAHETRTDWSMLIGSLFILISGAGTWSLDAWRGSRLPRPNATERNIPA
jgi:uncharacterized membrane protein YphA (DoxX/SURF4 family)